MMLLLLLLLVLCLCWDLDLFGLSRESLRLGLSSVWTWIDFEIGLTLFCCSFSYNLHGFWLTWSRNMIISLETVKIIKRTIINMKPKIYLL